jgi:hypothetical protein
MVSNGDQGQTMNRRKVVGLLLDLLLLAASSPTGGNLRESIRIIGLVVAGVALALAIALMVLMAVLLLDQRRPPYPM